MLNYYRMSLPNYNGRLEKKYIKLQNHHTGEISEDRLLFSSIAAIHSNLNNNNNNITNHHDVVDGPTSSKELQMKTCPVFQVRLLVTFLSNNKVKKLLDSKIGRINITYRILR